MHKLILALTVLGLLTACSAADQPNDPDNERSQTSAMHDELPEGTFADTGSGYHGEVFVRGYAYVITMNELFCEPLYAPDGCETFENVVFKVLETSNDNLQQFFMPQIAAYPDIDSSSVLLGCLEEGMINYSNHSEKLGRQEFQVDAATTAKILAATEEEPIVLALTKELLLTGGGAPDCYSQFTTIKIAE